MQEEIEQKTINLCISTTQLTARTLLNVGRAYLRHQQGTGPHGKQSVKSLLRQNRGVSSLEIGSTGIRGFERYARGRAYLRHQQGTGPHGKQSVKSLLRQNRGVSSLEIGSTGIRGFERYARRYGIDYAIRKDSPHGKQSVKSLLRQNRGVSSLEIGSTGIRGFERYARRYGIDYAIRKDITETPPRYLVFFKAPDAEAMNAALKEYAGFLKEKPRFLKGEASAPRGACKIAGAGAGRRRTPRQSPAQGTGARAVTTKKLTKLLALYLPYILLGLAATNFGEAWRLAEGKELGDRIMSMMRTFPLAFANPLPLQELVQAAAELPGKVRHKEQERGL